MIIRAIYSVDEYEHNNKLDVEFGLYYSEPYNYKYGTCVAVWMRGAVIDTVDTRSRKGIRTEEGFTEFCEEWLSERFPGKVRIKKVAMCINTAAR